MSRMSYFGKAHAIHHTPALSLAVSGKRGARLTGRLFCRTSTDLEPSWPSHLDFGARPSVIHYITEFSVTVIH